MVEKEVEKEEAGERETERVSGRGGTGNRESGKALHGRWNRVEKEVEKEETEKGETERIRERGGKGSRESGESGEAMDGRWNKGGQEPARDKLKVKCSGKSRMSEL